MNSAENIVRNVVDIETMSVRKAAQMRRVGSLLNKLEASLGELGRFKDIEGVEDAIQSLVSLRRQLSEKYDEYL